MRRTPWLTLAAGLGLALTAAAPAPAAPDRFDGVKELVVLLDASRATGEGETFSKAQEVVRGLFEDIPEGTRFDLMTFSKRCRSALGGQLRMSARAREKALERLAGLAPTRDAESDLAEALSAARRARPDLIIVVAPDRAEGREAALKELGKAPDEMRVDVFAVGGEAEGSTLAALAEARGGRVQRLSVAPPKTPEPELPPPVIRATDDRNKVVEVVEAPGSVLQPTLIVEVRDPQLEIGLIPEGGCPEHAVLLLEVLDEKESPRGVPVKIPVLRKGEALVTARILSLVGPRDARLRKTEDPKFQFLAVEAGDTLRFRYAQPRAKTYLDVVVRSPDKARHSGGR